MMVEPELKIISPENSINASNCQEFQHELLEEISTSTTPVVVVDMKGVDCVDSAGLMAFVSGMNLSRTLGKRLIICDIAPLVRIVFELTQLDGAFEIFENYEDVKAAIA
ncbi:STAS domain-containing protein [Merismopedia glauca]|uniref:Anti-anti-sigma factor n=1 Tax=Merismopedia glauca CCAP 1448/3 TaxID=1296344 RepID=A0A2T1BYV3_9CYAN|nr:STAS domain-containing protein [Merismopedia glauca]PSB01215.1 anti-anti-sigma factor [Merismopedia glauca CCAP 1448/3]